jgi:D-3-phosphoglycerate dehydrogenase
MPTAAINIPCSSSPTTNGLLQPVSKSPSANMSYSISPSQGSLHDRFRRQEVAQNALRQSKVLHPIEKDELRLLLLENISLEAVKAFKDEGFQVDHLTKSLTEDELVEKIGAYHAIGIRSKTKVTERVIKAATKLLVIGCFCIGTNQVDLLTAAKAGIPVFNSPFSNSRSVAELVMAEIVVLSRHLFDRARELKEGTWNKLSKNCFEVRGKTLGIIGYGHIGSQLSVLAESFGIRVLYYDVINIMPLGSARQIATLPELLAESDYVTLHVPELPETMNLISATQLSQMKKGSYLMNNARGKVVDIPALIEALQSGHLAGAALDVYPSEPGANGAPFDDQLNSWSSTLRALPNVILTPHIGGSTEEAQRMIGQEVSSALTRYLNFGSTYASVNFPEVDLRAIDKDAENQIRICHVHTNQPGVLRQVNEILSPYNVEKQTSDSKGDVAYLMADIADVSARDVAKLREQIMQTKANILTRLLA